MKAIKDFIKMDENYQSTVSTFTRIDGIFAIISYIILMGIYYIMGVIYEEKSIYLGIQVNLLLAVICVIFTLFRKQTLESIGFGKRNISKSIIFGIKFSVIIVAIQLVSGITSGLHFNCFSKLTSQFFYYFIIIALVEEIIFRGFIQTRIYGLIKKPQVAILITAFMFMSMHIPFQMGVSHMNFLAYISNNFITLLFTFGWHIVFNFMYAKYNSIAAPTIFHTIMDWSNELFLR